MKTTTFDILIANDGEDFIRVGHIVTPDEWASVHDWLAPHYNQYCDGAGDEALIDFFSYLRSVDCEVYLD